MQNWRALTRGLGLYRSVMSILAATYTSMFVLQIVSAYDFGNDWLADSRLNILRTVYCVGTLSADGLALLVGNQWLSAAGPVRRWVRRYLWASVLAFVFNLSAITDLIFAAGEASLMLGFVSFVLGWLKICFALLFLRACLHILGDPAARQASTLNWGLPGFALLSTIFDHGKISAGLATLLALIWLLAFLAFANRALIAFEGAARVAPDAFD